MIIERLLWHELLVAAHLLHDQCLHATRVVRVVTWWTGRHVTNLDTVVLCNARMVTICIGSEEGENVRGVEEVKISRTELY